LVTLGVVCDGSGFIRRSRAFAGNAVECRTLEAMLMDLGAPAGALVVMDRGMATAANLAWLKDHGYRYLVVSREGAWSSSSPRRRSETHLLNRANATVVPLAKIPSLISLM
jgi:hypothetical protein